MTDEMDRNNKLSLQATPDNYKVKGESRRFNHAKKRDNKSKNANQLVGPKNTPSYVAVDKRGYNRGIGNRSSPAKVAEASSNGFRNGTNLNHLTNFRLPERGQTVQHRVTNQRIKRKSSYEINQQFLQSNCQFVVQDGGDYMIYMADPNSFVCWETVEQVRLLSHNEQVCPICLDVPIAARITKCGHIFCWPCILHYFNVNNKERCPMCYKNIFKDDLKRVVIVARAVYQKNDTIEMTLMCREYGSAVSSPASEYNGGQFLNVNATKCTKFSRLLLATAQQIGTFLDADKRELERNKSELEGDDDQFYVQAALNLLKDEEQKLGLSKLASMTISEENEDGYADEAVSSNTENCSNGHKGHIEPTSPATFLHEDMVFFYQASDGQHIYLRPLCMDILKEEYGSFEKLPSKIVAPIVYLDNKYSDDGPKCCRHLPQGTPIYLAELQLGQPLVSQETLEKFKVEICKRQKDRQLKEKREKRRNRMIERKNRAVKGLSVPLDSLHFPACGLGSDDASCFALGPDLPGTTTESSRQRSVSESTTVSVDSVDSFIADDNYYVKPGPSFAELMQDGKSFSEMSVQKRGQQSSKSEVMSGPPPGIHVGEGSDEEMLAPRYDQSFSFAFEQALRDYQKDEPAGATGGTDTQDNNDSAQKKSRKRRGNKKSKKPVGKCIFATSMNRSSIDD